MFKLTSSFSSWPSEAYQVCMIKFVALRLFLLNCKVNPKVWVKSIQKNEDLIFRLIFKTLSIRFQNSIDLFVWPVNKLIKKNQAFLRLHYPNSPIQREKKWNEYWRVHIKKGKEIYEFEPKFVHWNRRMKTHKFITKSHARLPFHHYTAFSAGCHCSEQPYSTHYGQTSPLQGPQSLVIISRFLSMLFHLNMP